MRTAEVRVRGGGREWLRLVNPAESYLSSGSAVALFGLGGVSQVEWMGVRWADGVQEVFAGGAANRVVELRRGEGNKP